MVLIFLVFFITYFRNCQRIQYIAGKKSQKSFEEKNVFEKFNINIFFFIISIVYRKIHPRMGWYHCIVFRYFDLESECRIIILNTVLLRSFLTICIYDAENYAWHWITERIWFTFVEAVPNILMCIPNINNRFILFSFIVSWRINIVLTFSNMLTLGF